MIEKTRVAFKGLGKRVARLFEKKEKRLKARPKIVVVHESTVRRKRSSEDLGGHRKRSSLGQYGTSGPDLQTLGGEVDEEGVQYHAIGHPPGEEFGHQQQDPIRVTEGEYDHHAIGHLPAQEMEQMQQRALAAVASRSTVQQRPKGLVIDATVPADPDELDTGISPTNTQRPLRSPQEIQWPLAASAEEHERDLKNLLDGSRVALGQRRSTTVSSYVEPQERFDSYVDATDHRDVKTCCVHGVLLTDFAQLVAELEVLNNRIAMAKIRAAHARRSGLGPTSARPASWHVESTPMAPVCSCGRRVGPEIVQEAVKRQTWHAGETRAPRSRSRESETKEDVMLRHSAGTNLFRMSFLEGQRVLETDQKQEDGMDSTSRFGEHANKAPPKLDFNRGFDFRRECERIARRIRPTFAVSPR